MADINPRSTAQIAGHPLHPMIIPFPIVFFVTTLVTDVVYLNTHRLAFAAASVWLLGAGIVMALVAALLGFTDFLGERRIRALKQAWWHMTGNLLAVVLELVNFYLRYSAGPDAPVTSSDAILSAVVVVILLFNGWMGWEMVCKHHVAVADRTEP